jgi:hypothetical protein
VLIPLAKLRKSFSFEVSMEGISLGIGYSNIEMPKTSIKNYLSKIWPSTKP